MLLVNMGNIYFEQQKYPAAIKMYRMALDQVPLTSKRTRNQILRNIGIAFMRVGQYQVWLHVPCMNELQAPGHTVLTRSMCLSSHEQYTIVVLDSLVHSLMQQHCGQGGSGLEGRLLMHLRHLVPLRHQGQDQQCTITNSLSPIAVRHSVIRNLDIELPGRVASTPVGIET